MRRVYGSRHGEKGFVGIVSALVITVMLAFTGLAFDVGYLQWAKMGVQSAADAAAMGALRELELSHTTTIAAAGLNDSALNGFADGVRNTTVTINNPPLSGSYQGNSNAVEAVITRKVPAFFMMIFGADNILISARAVGMTTSASGSIGGCLFTLDTTATRAFQIAGAQSVSTACSVQVNSNDTQAFEMEGSEVLHLGGHAKVGVFGGWQLNGQSVIDDALNQPTNPVSLASRVTDPFSGVPVPAAGPVVSGHSVTYDMNNRPANNKLQPGVYCGGLTVNNTNGTTFKMAAGTYIMAGGGLRFQSQAIIDASAGVTVYNTAANASNMWGCGSTSGYSPISIDGQANLTMAAPTSGSLTGIAFFEDRSTSVTGSNPTANPNKIVGGSSTSINGALYFKNTQLQFSGANSATGYMVIVADMVQINGNSTFGNNYSSLSSSNYFAPQSTGGGLVE
jgi:Putative Flp pilus-assembly TadE/G-like